MAHAHVTYAANEWMKELTKKCQPIPEGMLSVVADITKPHTDLETRKRLSGDVNAVQRSIDEESLMGICRNLLIDLRRDPPREDKSACRWACVKDGS